MACMVLAIVLFARIDWSTASRYVRVLAPDRAEVLVDGEALAPRHRLAARPDEVGQLFSVPLDPGEHELQVRFDGHTLRERLDVPEQGGGKMLVWDVREQGGGLQVRAEAQRPDPARTHTPSRWNP